MAVKGKRKSQARGSQGRRRPAAAPRPVAVAPRRLPWYHTNAGRLMIGIGIFVLIAAVWWFIADARSEARALERQQDLIESYTGEINALSQSAAQAGAEMAAAPPEANERDAARLGRSARRWAQSFTNVQTEAFAVTPPEAFARLQTANQLLVESLQLYEAAAQTYALAPEAEGELVNQLLVRATSQRDRATAIWATAVQIIDEVRASVELGGSELLPPGRAAAAGAAQPGAAGVPLPPAPGAPGGETTEGGG